MPHEPGWDGAPVALLRLDADGLVLDANATGLGWLGRDRDDVLGRPLTDLLVVGGRIYWETHLSPILHVEGRFDEVALELRVPGGRLPVLVTAVVAAARHRPGADQRPRAAALRARPAGRALVGADRRAAGHRACSR